MNLYQSVRAKVADGRLPLPDEASSKAWAGPGSGQSCDGCEAPITAAEIEYEMDVPGRTVRFHTKCLFAWHLQR